MSLIDLSVMLSMATATSIIGVAVLRFHHWARAKYLRRRSPEVIRGFNG
jgi:hypothetical protein